LLEWMRSEPSHCFSLLLPMGPFFHSKQIFQGKTKLSLPAASSPNYDNAMKAGFKFEFSGMKTYWSNQETMHAFVNNILAPYFA
jgi:hypothetical protein